MTLIKIEEKTIEQVQKEPYTLPNGLQWSIIDLTKEEELDEFYNFLVTYYDSSNPDSKGGNYQKPIEINPEDTILMPRDSGLSSSYNQRNRNWFDLINELELDGVEKFEKSWIELMNSVNKIVTGEQ